MYIRVIYVYSHTRKHTHTVTHTYTHKHTQGKTKKGAPRQPKKRCPTQSLDEGPEAHSDDDDEVPLAMRMKRGKKQSRKKQPSKADVEKSDSESVYSGSSDSTSDTDEGDDDEGDDDTEHSRQTDNTSDDENDTFTLDELKEIGTSIAWATGDNNVELGVVEVIGKTYVKGQYLVPVQDDNYIGKWRRATEFERFTVSKRYLDKPGHLHPDMIAAIVEWKVGDTVENTYCEGGEMTQKEWDSINKAITEKYTL